MILLILCALLAGEFGYYQSADTLKCKTVIKHCFSYSIPCPEGMPGCLVLHMADSCWYEVLEAPDTLVDNGGKVVTMSMRWSPVEQERIAKQSLLNKSPLDSAELADLREMPKKLKALSQEIRALRRQIDFRTCLDTLKLRQNGQWYTDPKRPDTTWVTMGMPTVRDSCECVYGDRKGK